MCALPLQATFVVFRDRQVKAAGHCGGLQQAYCCVLWALGSSGRDIEKCADLCQRSRFLASTGVDKSCQLRTGGRMAVSRRWSVGSVLKRAVVLMGDKVQFGSFADDAWAWHAWSRGWLRLPLLPFRRASLLVQGRAMVIMASRVRGRRTPAPRVKLAGVYHSVWGADSARPFSPQFQCRG